MSARDEADHKPTGYHGNNLFHASGPNWSFGASLWALARADEPAVCSAPVLGRTRNEARRTGRTSWTRRPAAFAKVRLASTGRWGSWKA